MSSAKKYLLALVCGGVLGAGLITLWPDSKHASVSKAERSTQEQPLYWVAPMDANYRRDKPGKSPMGMDLVPVYAQDSNAESQPGAVTIAPHVINNLGVRTAVAEIKPLSNHISTVGYVQYDEDQLIHIHPRVEGWIEKLYVTAAGNPVQQGQALYTLYSPQLVNAQEELVIAIKRKNSSLISAAKERLKALQLSDDFIQTLAKQQKVQQNITFFSPKAGVVDGLNIREGFYVNPGNTIMSIASLEQVWVEAEVFERDTALIQKGLPVTMTLDYLPGKNWTGVVDYVYPTLDSQTRTLRVRLKFDNPNALLKPNMFTQVVIHANQIADTLVVPRQAVIRTGQQNRVVLALGEGQFKSIEVTIGRMDNAFIEITSGLEEGDRIVTSAQFLLDSESSKSSDFKRMQPQAVQTEPEVDSASVTGLVNAIDHQNRVLNISRGPIEKWNRPAATMDFLLSDNIQLDALSVGDEIYFTFEIRDDFIITMLSPIASSPRQVKKGEQ